MFQKNIIKISDKSSSDFPLSLLRYLVAAFTLITIMAVFIPLNPEMPSSGLDPSWKFTMNEAIAQNLKIGKDIIFTYGPYASVYTRIYHPATDHLMVLGSLFLGLFYMIVLLCVVKDKEWYILLLLLLFLAGFNYPRGVLFSSYPLILAIYISKFVTGTDQFKREKHALWQKITIALLFMPLGLIPLIKGSLLLICGAMVITISGYLLYHHNRILALITLISPILATVIFWLISGQTLITFPEYFINMSQIIFGYTESMATQGNSREILVYLLAAFAIILALVKYSEIAFSTKIFLSVYFALFLFFAFKSGFTRHIGHAVFAGTSLIIAGLVIGLISTDKRMMIALLLSVIVWAHIKMSPVNISARKVFENIRYTYVGTWDGLHSRITEKNNLQNRFEHSLNEIRKEFPLSTLQGTTDIYSYNQASLLASNNNWNTRPVRQS